MWNKTLIAYARVYPSAVLTVVEDSGYPWSVRCIVEFDDARELILFPTPPPGVVGGSRRSSPAPGRLSHWLRAPGYRPHAGRRFAAGHSPVYDAGAAQSARIPGQAREALDGAPLGKDASLPGRAVRHYSSRGHPSDYVALARLHRKPGMV